jgi:hypothetical protein
VIQGYWLSRPLPPAELEGWLEAWLEGSEPHSGRAAA